LHYEPLRLPFSTCCSQYKAYCLIYVNRSLTHHVGLVSSLASILRRGFYYEL